MKEKRSTNKVNNLKFRHWCKMNYAVVFLEVTQINHRNHRGKKYSKCLEIVYKVMINHNYLFQIINKAGQYHILVLYLWCFYKDITYLSWIVIRKLIRLYIYFYGVEMYINSLILEQGMKSANFQEWHQLLICVIVFIEMLRVFPFSCMHQTHFEYLFCNSY